jgi:hypothetical protein
VNHKPLRSVHLINSFLFLSLAIACGAGLAWLLITLYRGAL